MAAFLPTSLGAAARQDNAAPAAGAVYELRVYHASAAGDPAGVAFHGPGRLLELPVFDPSVHLGSVYLWYDTASERERPGGYSTTAPEESKGTADLLERLNRPSTAAGGLIDRLQRVLRLKSRPRLAAAAAR